MANHFVFDSVPQRPGTAQYGGGGIAGRPCPETAGERGVPATNRFAEVSAGTGASSVLEEDTSMQRECSFYVFNQSASELSVCLQVAPTNMEEYFVDDTSAHFTVPAGGKLVLEPQCYLSWTRLWYDSGPDIPSFVAYFNARV